MTLQEALEQWVAGRDISRDAMRAVMTTVMTGEASQAQIGALLVALRMKGEGIEEIAGAAEVMRELVTPVAVTGDYVIDGLSVNDRNIRFSLEERLQQIDNEGCYCSGCRSPKQLPRVRLSALTPASEDSVYDHGDSRDHELIRSRSGRRDGTPLRFSFFLLDQATGR